MQYFASESGAHPSGASTDHALALDIRPSQGPLTMSNTLAYFEMIEIYSTGPTERSSEVR